jgi:DNA polymerase-1
VTVRVKFTQEIGVAANFYYVNPPDATEYAATDAIGTYRLVMPTYKYFKEAGLSAKIENEFLYFLMLAEEEKTFVDYKMLDKIAEETVERINVLSGQIYNLIGYSFQINSSSQLADALKFVGVDTGSYTKKGHMKTGGEFLERVENQHPVIPLIMEYQILQKSFTAYLKPISEQARVNAGGLRFNYQTGNVPTGRLSGGKDAKNPFFADLNIQAITKPHSQDYFCEYTGRDDEDSILGWTFTPAPKGYNTDPANKGRFVIEGFDRKASIRRAFTPGDDSYWVSIDFSAQELRIPALISGEPLWIKAFKNGEDVHYNTACAIYGAENYSKEKRKLAKAGNFGILYGQTEYAFSIKHDIPLEDAQKFFVSFWSALSVLKGWKERHCRKVRKEGTAYTMFGRPRRVKWYFAQANSKVVGFAYRTAVNTVIQGSGADILRIAFTRVFKKVLLNPLYREFVRFLSTIHDEINYAVKKNKIYEIVPKLVECMQIKLPNWPIGMEVGLEIGNSWGWTFKFKMDESGKYVPKYDILS